jgi:hypothetical protein
VNPNRRSLFFPFPCCGDVTRTEKAIDEAVRMDWDNPHSLYDATGDETVKKKTLELIETEHDLKHLKKYASLWKTK